MAIYIGGPLCLTIDLLNSVNPKNHLTRKRSGKLIFPIQHGLSHLLMVKAWTILSYIVKGNKITFDLNCHD